MILHGSKGPLTLNKHKHHLVVPLFIILFGGSVCLYMSASSLVSRYITLTLGTRTTLNSLSFKPPYLTIRDIKIKNPKSYSLPFALTAQKVSVKTPYLNYLRNPVVIEEFTLENVYLDIEFLDDARTKGNWITLIRNASINHATLIPRYSIINKLNINNLHLVICLNDEEPRRLPTIRHVTFSNIHTDNGRLIEELTELIVKKMMNEVSLQRDVQTLIGLPFSIFDLF